MIPSGSLTFIVNFKAMEDGPIIMILPSNIEVPIKNTDWSGFILKMAMIEHVPIKHTDCSLEGAT